MANALFLKGKKGFLDGSIDLDTDTIKVVLVDMNDVGKVITGATNATPIVITSTSHGFANGDIVTIGSVGGNTAANIVAKVANQTTNTFELQNADTGANIAGNGAYTSGGFAMKISGSLSLNDVAAGGRIATVTLGSITITESGSLIVFDAADSTFTAVSGDPSEALIIYKDTGTASTSWLIGIFDTVTGLPVTPNGGDIVITWNATGILAI